MSLLTKHCYTLHSLSQLSTYYEWESKVYVFIIDNMYGSVTLGSVGILLGKITSRDGFNILHTLLESPRG